MAKVFGLDVVVTPGIPDDMFQFVGQDRIDSFTVEDGKLVEHHTAAISPEDAARIKHRDAR